MAVLGRLLISSAERLDLSDVISVDSYSAGDWKFFLKGLVGDSKPYILKGFDVIDPQNAIGTQGCSISVADSVVFYPGSSAGAFYHGLPSGDPNALPLVPELRKNAVNYVYLTFSTFDTSSDTRAFWDPDKDNGLGGEFTQDVNTESVLSVNVNVSTGSFPANTIPVAKITVGPVVITAIEDARDMLFRLGTGGISPNPYNSYSFRSLPSSSYQRSEPSGVMTSASDPNPFQGADKNIYSLKEWMDVVMTKLMEMGGTTHWYEDTSTFSLVSMFHDVLASTFKSKGEWQHSSATPGLLTWTEDLFIKDTSGPRDIIIRAGNATIANEQVMYLPLVRNQFINTYDSPVAWTNGQNYVNTVGGSVGLFANLSKGDWIKKAGDGNHLYLRVEEFYDSVNLGGSVTTAALAKSVRLNGTYNGTTGNDRARYDKGVYQSSDIAIDNRSSSNLTAAGGNLHWLAIRSDTIESISAAQSFTVSGSVVSADGTSAKVSATAHGLEDGDIIQVATPVALAGAYSVDVQDANTFFISTSNLTTGAFTGYYALITTAARSNGYGLQLESANHNFDVGDTIVISGTTNYNGAFVVNVRTTTEIQFGISAAFAEETTGSATLARLNLRAEEGIVKIVQGESISIGAPDTDNIRRFIGMASLSEIRPNYYTPTSYGTLEGFANFNGALNDSLTERVSKLTSMMADKAQDKTIGLLASNADFCDNSTSGSNQVISFSSFSSGTPTLNVVLPHTVTGTITLTGSLSLATNQVAYFLINRNNSFSISDLSGVTVANLTDVPVDENLFVFAIRLSTTDVWLWDGKKIQLGGVVLEGAGGTGVIATLYDPVSTTLITGSPVVVDGVTVADKNTVLFSNLSSGNNMIYKATVSGGNVTGWTPIGVFKTGLNPTASESVIFAEGTSFAQQTAIFDGTTFKINETVRYFTGTDYWEMSAIKTSTLLDNASGNVFTLGYQNSENIIVEYSIVRGTTKETGTLHITTDGTNVAVTTTGAYIGTSGVAFNGDILATDLRLRYTTTSTGSNAIMKYYIKRWANGAGGPGGPPSYTSGASVVAAGGSNGDIQYNASGNLAGNSNFQLDTGAGLLKLNGLEISILTSTSLLDNQVTATNLFSFPASYNFTVVEYSINKSGDYRVGRFLITNDGTNVSISDDFVEQNPTGVVFSAAIVASNVVVQYVSSATGSNGTFKYSMRRWS